MDLPPDLKRLLEVFNDNKVEYLVVGSQAFAYYGKPRYTKDLDLLVRTEIENGERVERALAEFGARSLGWKASDFEKEGFFIVIGNEPSRVDLITSILGVDFTSAWRNKSRAYFGKVPVYVLSLADLIESKRATGRWQDLADLEVLERLYELKGGRWVKRKKVAPRKKNPKGAG